MAIAAGPIATTAVAATTTVTTAAAIKVVGITAVDNMRAVTMAVTTTPDRRPAGIVTATDGIAIMTTVTATITGTGASGTIGVAGITGTAITAITSAVTIASTNGFGATVARGIGTKRRPHSDWT